MAKPPVKKQKPPKSSSSVSTANAPVVQGGNLKSNSKHSVAQIQHTSFSGPMPHPSVLEGYENLVPGAAERILVMAEADANHQREIELLALRAAEGEVKRGQLFGLTIGVTALGAAMMALYMGSPAVAGIIGGTTVVGLVSVFIVGRLSKTQ